jgi:DNA ligase (NAD+)
MYKKVKNLNQEDFKNLLLDLAKEYEHGVPSVTDEEFDRLVELYEDKFDIKYQEVGALQTGIKVQLPYPLRSLDKAKEKEAENKLKIFSKKYDGPYNISDKLDGTAGLYIVKHLAGGKVEQHLYTRGNGTIGTDISHIIQCLKLPVPKKDIAVRGEIVFPLKNFNAYVTKEKAKGTKKKLNNPRNVGTGIILAESFNKQACLNLTFVSFQILSDNNMGQEEQYEYLKNIGFNIPWNIVTNDISTENLRNLLLERKEKAPYDVDGLVVSSNKHYDIPFDKNPKHQIAFKLDKFINTTVTDVVWKASKDGLLKPVVRFKPVFIAGATIQKAYAHNAKYIVEEGIGIGAEITVTRGGDVIPDVVDVITKADEVKLPDYNEDEYEWNESGVEFVLTHPESNPEVQRAVLEYFVTHMGIENLKSGRIKSLYDIGIKTIEDLITADVKTISTAERMGLKSAQTIYNNIHNKITGAPLAAVMTSSGVFGPGFGDRKIIKIVEAYPDILDYVDAEEGIITEMLIKIGGFSKMATIFEENLPDFVLWLENHPDITIQSNEPKKIIKKSITTALSGKVIVFTGFRDDIMKKQMEEQGATLLDKVAAKTKTDILVVKDLSKTSANTTKAQKQGAKIMSHDDFVKEYNLTTKDEYRRTGVIKTIVTEKPVTEIDIIQSKIVQALKSADYGTINKLLESSKINQLTKKKINSYINNVTEIPEFDDEDINDFYYQFLVHLLFTTTDMNLHIKKLTELVENQDNKIKKVVHLAANNILNHKLTIKKTPSWNHDMSKLYCCISGFLILCYQPAYTYNDIFKILEGSYCTIQNNIIPDDLIKIYFNK